MPLFDGCHPFFAGLVSQARYRPAVTHRSLPQMNLVPPTNLYQVHLPVQKAIPIAPYALLLVISQELQRNYSVHLQMYLKPLPFIDVLYCGVILATLIMRSKNFVL